MHVAERIIHVYLISREVNARELIRLNKINSSYTEARGRQSGGNVPPERRKIDAVPNKLDGILSS